MDCATSPGLWNMAGQERGVDFLPSSRSFGPQGIGGRKDGRGLLARCSAADQPASPFPADCDESTSSTSLGQRPAMQQAGVVRRPPGLLCPGKQHSRNIPPGAMGKMCDGTASGHSALSLRLTFPGPSSLVLPRWVPALLVSRRQKS